MQFSGNIWLNNRLAPRFGVGAPVWEILDPPLDTMAIYNELIVKESGQHYISQNPGTFLDIYILTRMHSGYIYIKKNAFQHVLGRGGVSQHALGRGCVCIPACTGRGGWIQACTGWGCLPGVSAQGVSTQTGVSAQVGVGHPPSPLWTESQMPVKS